VLWHKPFTRALDDREAPFFKWFEDGELNVSYNCLDRHLGTPVEHKTAILFEADDGTSTAVTYRDLYHAGVPFRQRTEGAGLQEG
jgi:acetyl-CoA synthetase